MINSLVNKVRPFAKWMIGTSLRPIVNRAYFSILGSLYTGEGVYCYCCNKSYRKFLPYSTYGKQVRNNAQCPGCGSLERHRLMMAFLRNDSSLFSKKNRLLHFAPEDVLQRIFKGNPSLSYLSVDLYSPLAMVKMDIMNLQLEDQSYDVILCNHVLAHVDSDIKAMMEMNRVLSKGGWMLVTTTIDFTKPTYEVPGPLTNEEKKKVYGQEDLCRVYGFDIIDRLKRCGFEVDKINYASNFSMAEQNQFGFNSETILLCRKPN